MGSNSIVDDNVDTADEKIDHRDGTTAALITARDAIEKKYVDDKVALEKTYQKDIRDNRIAQERALVAAGLNPDGSDPQGREQGSTV